MVVVAEVYPAGESPSGASIATILWVCAAHGHCEVIPLPNSAGAARVIKDVAGCGDLVVCLARRLRNGLCAAGRSEALG